MYISLTGKTLWLAAVMASAILFESLSVNMYFHHLFRMGLHLKVCVYRVWGPCVCVGVCLY